MQKLLLGCVIAAIALAQPAAAAEVTTLNVPLGAGGFGFLPLHMMRKHGLVEKHAKAAGIQLSVNWANVGGPAAMNDALLSGQAHFISAGPPAFITLWDKTRRNIGVKGAAAISSMPMFLNTNAAHIKKLEDFKSGEKMAVTSVKVSIPSIIMQMHAKASGEKDVYRYDPITVSMKHPDAVVALLSGGTGIVAHYASSPFHEIEIKKGGIHTIQSSDDVMGGSTTFTMVSTTTKFYKENPKVYRAFLGALKESQDMIKADPKGAIGVLIASMGGKSPLSEAELLAILQRPATKYTPRPENVLKYAAFMHEIGSISNKPASLADLFFEEGPVKGGN
ncbi:MAG TPA: ABC transporter substrate-binding protein [Hyphomicrobiaceae bacterium]|nr:ABC transporter substrate-binding protein [Hyphomicrobiaceae bacterium]